MVGQTDTLWQTGGTGRVDQECKVPLGLDAGLRVVAGVARAADAAKVAELAVPLVTEQDDAILREAGLLRGGDGRPEERLLGDEGLGARVPQLEGELIRRVERVRGRDNAAGPEGAQGHDRGVDRVGSVEGEHVGLLPAPDGLETLAKLDRSGAQIGPAVGAPGRTACHQLLGRRKLLLLPPLVVEHHRPQVDIVGDGDVGERRCVRHGERMIDGNYQLTANF